VSARAWVAASCVFALACAGAAVVRVPPAGISLAEPGLDASVELAATPTMDASAKAQPLLARVDSCEVPRAPQADASVPEVEHDVAYGPDPRQRYDLAIPATSPKLLVVMIHGGGWTSGRKSLFLPTIRTFASLGYLAASLEYRLASSGPRAFPVGLADVRCGLRAAQARARALGAARTVVIGASSGGHYAAMLALAGDAKGFDGDCAERGPVHVDGAVLYYAPLELDRTRERYPPKMVQAVDELFQGASVVKQGGGMPLATWNAEALAATPRRYVDGADPPILELHGEADPIVPIEDSRDLAAALDAAHVPALLVELPEQKHGFPVLGRSAALQPASCTTLRFLQLLQSAAAR
jgi:acetyl esterase/lipase